MQCLSCYSISQEARKVLSTCYEFQNQIEYGSNEVNFFITEIENCLPTITGAEVCVINREMLQAFFVGLVQYYIVIVQFDKAIIISRAK